VLHGIDVAHSVGLGPIKINMVVKGGMNEHEIVPMARHFKDTPHILRFIEYMDVGASNGWNLDEVIPSSDVVQRINEQMPLTPLQANYTAETATRWRYKDGSGEIGVISSVTGAFCGACTRARLSTEGKLYTCLFATGGHDVRALLRAGRSDAEISTVLAHLWRARSDRYSEMRSEAGNEGAGQVPGAKKVEMSYIGG
jgi:cyclic pyranopterin phosphate synthase